MMPSHIAISCSEQTGLKRISFTKNLKLEVYLDAKFNLKNPVKQFTVSPFLHPYITNIVTISPK